MATLDQQGNIIPEEPLEQLEEVTVTGKRLPVRKVAGIDWNVVLTTLIGAGLVYLFDQLTKQRRRRRRSR